MCIRDSPYSATDVVKHRGSLPANTSIYPSSYQARKLFNLLEENFKNGTPLHTLGVIDPVQMSQLARCRNIKVAYISGWACSSTLVGSTNEVSPDFGDYPYDTVPNQVERIFKAQQLHDRKAFLEASIKGSTPVSYTHLDVYKRQLQGEGEKLRKPGIEPGAQRWQRWILPLNHLREVLCGSNMSPCY